MLYYKIKFNQIPQVTFAHNFTRINYFAKFDGGSNSIEIVYIEKGSTMVETDGIAKIVNENSIFLAFHKNKLKFRPLKDTIHTHYTVNILCDHELEICNEIDEKAYEPTSSMILPLYINLKEDAGHFANRIKEIMKEYNSHNLASGYKSSAMAVELLADISRYSVAQMNTSKKSNLPSQYLISNQIKQYVSDNISKSISLKEIAQLLEKTPNYLNSIFKKINGITIKHYVIEEKISKVMQLISNYHISLKDAGEYVGIYDQNYLSRLFKKVTSMSAKTFIENSYKK